MQIALVSDIYYQACEWGLIKNEEENLKKYKLSDGIALFVSIVNGVFHPGPIPRISNFYHRQCQILQICAAP